MKFPHYKTPVPVDTWDGILQTKSPLPACLQLDFSRAIVVHGREDCLFLNVFTPNVMHDSLLFRQNINEVICLKCIIIIDVIPLDNSKCIAASNCIYSWR